MSTAVTKAFIQRGNYDLAIVHFTPTPVEHNGWKVMLTMAWAYTVNGPTAYVTGHGRMIKKDGTVGVRVIEVDQSCVPLEARKAIKELIEARQAV